MSNDKYDSDLVINVSKVGDGRYVIDLNLLSLEGFLGSSPLIARSARGVAKAFFDEHIDSYSSDMNAIAKPVAQFILGYSAAGRGTVYNAVKAFFDFQVDRGRNVHDPSTLQEYVLSLQKKIYSREIGRTHALGLLSIVNKLLLYLGVINSPYRYNFQHKGRVTSSNVYTSKELEVVVKVAFEIFSVNKEIIDDHIRRTVEGFRDFSLVQLAEVKEVKWKSSSIVVDLLCRNPVYWFMHSSFVLFCFFTWSNESQLCQIEVDSINSDDKGMETDWIFKGRAKKFVRLNIGDSSVQGDKKGLVFFKEFMRVRNELVKYLLSNNYTLNHNSLFFMISRADDEIRRFKPALVAFNRHPLVVALKNNDILMPRISSQSIRKTVEQLADNEIGNPFVTLNKAQHTWATYRNNYALGNPEEARQAMSKALGELTRLAINKKSIDERRVYADSYGVNLASSGEVPYQINGLGCLDEVGGSQHARRFISKQRNYKRNPKICADLSNCINCPNCAVVEDEEAIYHLLSFKHMIEYNKAVYISSKKAVENYKDIVDKINFALSFVDVKIIARAKRRLQIEGVSDAWKE
ncbi:hypothetical protein [Oceanimonas doudoroffii]|uniref:hypothetical protein n=1 Tax=Oceanimonas doudoroffii TaxID=84158 RepID=UPI0011406C35|nr:hypothetical protein [Oceanimonas doudoroffii]